ncbi:hypothetical protein OG252_26365 [Streptomyces sp. NBC_01352]|uniref:DUF6907 domain-containing protein n=1 Tax=Streptomyces sp. NBC_01352 TaxID=2903834 RepID=UPI002E30DDD6|nr:hypothetical protein [Streptomyces sp. NBC_01352]
MSDFDDEQERAQRSVERAFPEVARFLDQLPTYGPTEVFREEDVTPDAVVRVAFALSREQLMTALSIGFTELVPDVDAETITVEETRKEVEGWLHAAAVIELDRYVTQGQLTAYPVEAQPVMDALGRALDRAYPPRTPEPVRRAPRYGDGTVTLETFDHGEVTVPEPAWCIGHSWQPNPHRADITHNSTRVKAAATTDGAGRVHLLKAYISHAPHLEIRPEPHPVVSVQLECIEDFAAEDIPQLIEGLKSAERVLANIAAEAIRLRGES